MNDTKSKLPALSVLIVGGWAILAVVAHGKLIHTVAATIVGAIWMACVGLASGIWRRVQNTLEELAFGAIDVHLRDIVSGYRQRYLSHLRRRYATLDVKGLVTRGPFSLEIEAVYVELALAPKQAAKVYGHPVPTVTVTEGQHDLWTFLSSRQIGTPNFAILGAPGSGKTTLLEHVTLLLAARRSLRTRIKRTPVLLFISDHAADIAANPERTIIDVVNASTRKMPVPAPEGWFQREFNRGRCLVMLDGLDEIADDKIRETVAKWVDAQMKAFDNNPFLVTSRPFGYRSNPLSRVNELEVCPFTLEQTERFIKQWYMESEAKSALKPKKDKGVQIRAREGADDLLKRLRNTPDLAELAVNPLLLTMIANVHRENKSLPSRRVDLYTEICEVFLGKTCGSGLNVTSAQIKSVLQQLALAMMRAEKRELPLPKVLEIIAAPLTLISGMDGEKFIDMVKNWSGLLIEWESGSWGFAHLTFQEYLAASEVVEGRLKEELVHKVTESWWHETIRLYVALADATPIVEACISGEKPTVAQLTLAVECLDEARLVQPHLRNAVEALVEAGLEDPDPERARLAAETKLELRLRRLIRIDDKCYLDTQLISCAEYQLFIDARQAAGDYRQPDHWPETHFSAGSAREPVLGVSPSDAEAFCEWLSERHGGEWSYRIPDKDSEQDTSENSRYWIRTLTGIRLCGAPSAAPLLTSEMLRERIIENIRAGDSNPAYRVLDLVLDRVVDCVLNLDVVDEVVRARDIDFVRDRIRDIESCRRVGLDVVGELDLRDVAYTFLACIQGFVFIAGDKAFNFDRDDYDDFIRDVVRSIDLARDIFINYFVSDAFDRDRAFQRGDCSISQLLLLFCVSFCFEFRENEERQKLGSSPVISAAIDRLLDAYIALVLLGVRIEGRFPAFEGIRIMKVHHAPSDRSMDPQATDS